VALPFVNEPSSDDPDFFKGKALTYYGRWRTSSKRRAARSGTVATLIIHDQQPSDDYSPHLDFTGDAVVARFGLYADRRRRGNPRWRVGFPAVNLRQPEKQSNQ